MGTRPTRVRYLVLTLTTLGSILLYLDRYCISFAESYIRDDLGLSDDQVAWILGAFFLTYALGQVPTGFLTDRFGARVMLTLYILLWSLFTGLTGMATGFLTLLFLRFGFGFAQSGAYPASASLISKWVPFSSRGFASSLVAFGGRMGGFVAPLLTALLIVSFVPVDTPSLLGVDDILDYPRFCRPISQLDAPTRDALLADLRPADCEAMVHHGREYGTNDIAAVYFADEVERVVEGLNKALQRPGLAKAVSLKDRLLPGEAENLRHKAPAELTDEEVERLNRLVLETLCPEGMRKIYGQGWRPTMMVFGLVGMVIAALFWLWFRDWPHQHPACNAAEIELIEGSRPTGAPTPHGKASRVPLGQIVGSVSMWLMCVSQIGTNIGWLFLVTWLPRYLEQVHRLPIGTRSVLASLPLLAGWIGLLAGGWFTDWFVRRVPLRWARALPIAFTRLVAMAAYLVCLVYPELWVVMIAFCLVGFASDFGIPAMWAFNLDIGGRYVGSILGWGNMWGNLGAAITPPLLQRVVGDGHWDQAFWVCALAFLIAGVCSLGIDASRPVVTPEEQRPTPEPG